MTNDNQRVMTGAENWIKIGMRQSQTEQNRREFVWYQRPLCAAGKSPRRNKKCLLALINKNITNINAKVKISRLEG